MHRRQGCYVSETDSFIEEVSEEVRRDRLFALMRKYGWIAVLVVLLLVGGAAYNEWRKATETAAAQELGDSLLTALEQGDGDARAKALALIAGKDDNSRALVAMLVAAEAQSAGDKVSATQALTTLSEDMSQPKVYRDLARLKLVLVAGTDMAVDERREKLGTLAIAGAPFRLLAEEQLALLEIEEGNSDAAISRLTDIIGDVEVTAGLRNRASQLIVVLGGEIDAS